MGEEGTEVTEGETDAEITEVTTWLPIMPQEKFLVSSILGSETRHSGVGLHF